MKKVLFFSLIFIFSSAYSSGVIVKGIAPNNNSASMLERYLSRLKSVRVGESLSCEGNKSNITVVFHRKDSDEKSRVSLYGTLNGREVFIPYYNGNTEASKSNQLHSNVIFGQVMKEFESGEALNQKFMLSSDDLKLAVKITKKRALRKELVIDQDLLTCTALY